MRDISNSSPTIVVNEALAHRYFPNQNPIGVRTIVESSSVLLATCDKSGLDRPATPEIYRPFGQDPAATSQAGHIARRPRAGISGNAGQCGTTTIHQVNPNQAIFNVKTMEQVIASRSGDLNLYVWLLGVFAGLASVARRRRNLRASFRTQSRAVCRSSPFGSHSGLPVVRYRPCARSRLNAASLRLITWESQERSRSLVRCVPFQALLLRLTQQSWPQSHSCSLP